MWEGLESSTSLRDVVAAVEETYEEVVIPCAGHGCVESGRRWEEVRERAKGGLEGARICAAMLQMLRIVTTSLGITEETGSIDGMRDRRKSGVRVCFALKS